MTNFFLPGWYYRVRSIDGSPKRVPRGWQDGKQEQSNSGSPARCCSAACSCVFRINQSTTHKRGYWQWRLLLRFDWSLWHFSNCTNRLGRVLGSLPLLVALSQAGERGVEGVHRRFVRVTQIVFRRFASDDGGVASSATARILSSG